MDASENGDTHLLLQFSSEGIDVTAARSTEMVSVCWYICKHVSYSTVVLYIMIEC